MLRETLLVTGKADRAEKEVVAAAVSAANRCPYCVAVHTAAAQDLLPGLDGAGIAAGNLADPLLAEIADWARSTSQPSASQSSASQSSASQSSASQPSASQSSASQPGAGPAAPPGSFAELAGVAVMFHYLNRMVTIFLPESPLPPMTPKGVGGWVMGMLASSMVSPKPVPGDSLELLPAAPLPDELSWAARDARIAAAFGAAAAAIEEAADGVVTPPVRELVAGRLRSWDGRPPGPGRDWADKAVAPLGEADRPAGALAIRTALAPYQVVKADINDFRSAAQAGDEAVVSLTSWASMAAARTAGSWLHEPSS
jgi:hypothetical protein